MMKFKSLFLVAALSLSACTAAETTVEDGLVISDARIQEPLKGKTITAGYFDITNFSKVDDAIIGVESPAAGRVELHLTESVDGVMTMRRHVSVDLKSGHTVSFEPGGFHLMLFDVDINDASEDAALTFKFKHAPDVTIIAELDSGAAHTSHH